MAELLDFFGFESFSAPWAFLLAFDLAMLDCLWTCGEVGALRRNLEGF